ncbi:MAG: phage tail protein [Synergistaceae bacterium]|jgi:phage protein U|nr:phage tail protein [Synergistaceae bacterium]
MAIGSLGLVVFEVSAEKVRTFDGLKRSGTARFAYHNRQGGKELPEFLGPSAESISLEIRLSAYERVNPTKEVTTLRTMRDTGEAVFFILDGVPQGEGFWVIESISEEHSYFDNRGRPIAIKCSLTLKEYLPTME